ncbi:MAG: fasciclin domain-containing protein [Bacteroidota bacterium]
MNFLVKVMRIPVLVAFSVALASVVALADAHKSKQKMDVVDTAISAGSFNTLVEAVVAADLVETLKGEGPFTVFAPTDEAFAKIPANDLQALINDREALTKVLTYHVVPGNITAEEIQGMTSAQTVEGSSITIDTSDGVMVDNAKVIQADIMTSNGVIHFIDSVIIPQS